MIVKFETPRFRGSRFQTKIYGMIIYSVLLVLDYFSFYFRIFIIIYYSGTFSYYESYFQFPPVRPFVRNRGNSFCSKLEPILLVFGLRFFLFLFICFYYVLLFETLKPQSLTNILQS